MIASLPIMLKHFIPDQKPRNPCSPERKLSDHTFHDYDDLCEPGFSTHFVGRTTWNNRKMIALWLHVSFKRIKFK